MKKTLISAEFVRQEHAAGRKRIEALLPQAIVTAEARVVAQELGVAIVESVVTLPSCKILGQEASGATPVAASPLSSTAPPGEAEVAAIRAAILAKLPPGCVSDAVVDQLIRRTIEERRNGSTSTGGEGAYAMQRIARGIKHVRSDSVSFGLFEGAGAKNQVGLTDVVTAHDGSPMAAGYMAWSNCFFPWTLTYDEIDVVLEGELHIRSEGQTVIGHPGDVIFIPKGAAIEFGTPSRVRFLYVTYPADWQG
ncbi:ethanolamine utilization acetate kinase EutQ [Dechloromonas sp. ARDL1]|uniref:ethanolamine utilization acetate kinase EutQ n=1 Tax=Dechloromonas sp. ARDL1 TaxID=3322121 RepID=UPI003DA6EF87